jgi:hypothetical protein
LPLAPLQGDLLWFSRGSAPVSGLLVEETAEGVTFRLRRADGSTDTRVYPVSEVRRVVRTVDAKQLSDWSQRPAIEGFQVAETWLSITSDQEAQFQGQQLLSHLLTRADLSPELRRAVECLQVASLRPGVRRDRLWRHLLNQTRQQPNAEVPRRLPEAPDAWQWDARRLDSSTRAAWQAAIRQDRQATADLDGQGQRGAQGPAVERSRLSAAVQNTRQTLPADHPLLAWVTQVSEALAADDAEALLAMVRLELALETD